MAVFQNRKIPVMYCTSALPSLALMTARPAAGKIPELTRPLGDYNRNKARSSSHDHWLVPSFMPDSDPGELHKSVPFSSAPSNTRQTGRRSTRASQAMRRSSRLFLRFGWGLQYGIVLEGCPQPQEGGYAG
ncbi:hypothetical protein BDV29DRAFT_41348 [Aspergillus leporis]|uniref:Uncharacterized protein n=1 Tax=Aspergillus leporis TaxID=41062 RepID=A0A5N5XAH1_9EURO|nr:hypothetical protein BDV29DRAFT_41348 [Aspergillus leporis]